MELFWKTIGGILISLVLRQGIGKQEKDIGLLLNIAVCCMGGTAIVSFLEPVVKLVQELSGMMPGKVDAVSLLLKIAGIALISEISEMICRDAGNGSLGKVVRLLSNAVILWLSVPAFRNLLNIVRELLGDL